MTVKNLTIIFISALMAISCRNSGTEGPFRSTIEMCDTSSAYSVSVYALFPADFPYAEIPLHIEAVSPCGIKYTEDITFPCGYKSISQYRKAHPEDDRIDVSRSGGTYAAVWLWRDNIRPSEYGKWEITIGTDKKYGSVKTLKAVCLRKKDGKDNERKR